MALENELPQTFSRRVLITVSIVLLMLALAALVFFAIDVLLLLFGAVLLAIFLHGLANISRRYLRLSEGYSVLLVSFILTAVLVLSVWMLAPSVADQVKNLRTEVPQAAQNVTEYLSGYSWGKLILEQMPSSGEIVERVGNSNVLSRVGGYFSSTIGVFSKIAQIRVCAKFYMKSAKR
jgi:predicted PurR-regulated permease PerM